MLNHIACLQCCKGNLETGNIVISQPYSTSGEPLTTATNKEYFVELIRTEVQYSWQ